VEASRSRLRSIALRAAAVAAASVVSEGGGLGLVARLIPLVMRASAMDRGAEARRPKRGLPSPSIRPLVIMRPAPSFSGALFFGQNTPGKGPLPKRHARRQLLANAAIAASRVCS
jgi:hypothetical protein